MSLIRNPFAMRGRIEKCWLFSYRTSPDEVRAVLPGVFEPVTYGSFAFWNLVICRVSALRPRLVPAALGISYWHVAYRVPVRYRSPSGEIEGLYFVRSDCDSAWIARAGNMMTDFNFHRAGIEVEERGGTVVQIRSPRAAARVEVTRETPSILETGSPFPDLAFADRFLKYKPAALSVLPDGNVQVLKVVRDENAWKDRLVRVKKADWDFLKDKKAVFEICQEVKPIEYQWNPGEIQEP